MNRGFSAPSQLHAPRRRAAFLLLETMIGVAVFAMGVLVLARCLDHCINAEMIKSQDQLARLILENRMAEIEGGSVRVDETVREDKLEGRFAGFTIRQSRVALDLKNENDVELSNLFKVNLEAIWSAPEGEQSKALAFYMLSPD